MHRSLGLLGAALLLATVLAPTSALAKRPARVPFRPEKSGLACSDAARATALALLKLHSEGDDRAAIEGPVLKKRSVRAPEGKGKLDVLALTGVVYKAKYQIRIYYLPGGGCARAGFELVELGLGR